MARSRINVITTDLISDAGNSLWSLVQGEQLEYPITVGFLGRTDLGHTFSAVVAEGLNTTIGKDKIPTAIRPNGIVTTLSIRNPVNRDLWNATLAYNAEEIVLYNNSYYRLTTGTSRVNSTTPALDSAWALTSPNIIYIRFPETLGTNWLVGPSVSKAAYGFFELQVSEPPAVLFKRVWKPVRGTVELLFSPTEL
jgi:hypothetical protein